MKKIGIVGGVAWQSTAEYYSELCRRSERWHLDRNPGEPARTPEMSIESLDLSTAVSYLGSDGDEKSWSRFDDYHREALQRLEKSGAEFAVIACNSAHHRFDAIVRGIGIPVISILEAVAKESTRIGACDILILGTALTMRSQRFREGFAKYGVEAAGPDSESARLMTTDLIAQLQSGRVEGMSERIGSIAKQSFKRQFGAQRVVCLACTELSLAFPEQKMLATFSHGGVLYVNTTAVHINAAFDFAVNSSERPL
ncbi:MAG TPA: amino acid racemase [Candidatus Acidoferrales bacterium]